MSKNFKLIQIFIYALWPYGANSQIVLAENIIYSGHADINDLGQSFTIDDTIVVTSVELNVATVNGGAEFTVYLSTYDPWNHVHGDRLCEKLVGVQNVSAYPVGSWVTVDFRDQVTLTPGIYSINIDTESNGAPDGYNTYAVTSSNVFVGGRRILAPSSSNQYTNHHDLAFRIFGFGSPSSLIPPAPMIPTIQVWGISTRTFTSSKFLDYSHETDPGIVYFRQYSFNLESWSNSSSSDLGDGGVHSDSASDLGRGGVFIRVQPVNLGDTVARRK